MRIGIIGSDGNKFAPASEADALRIIREILTAAENPVLVSGGCHLGGVDIFAEHIADLLKIPKDIKLPKTLNWSGFKERNLEIARDSDEVHVIVVSDYPPDYKEQRVLRCHHCLDARPPHVSSGACWTGKRALEMSKKVKWYVVHQVTSEG